MPLVTRTADLVDGVIVHWEGSGPASPEAIVPPEAVEDLRRVREATSGLVIARVNRFGPWTEAEVGRAIELGADEILLPLVRSEHEVEETLRIAGGRCGVGLVVETLEAIAIAPRLAALPIRRAHLGLIDLARERGSPHMYTAVVDGTAETLRRAFTAPVGFGGVTLPGLGEPIPSRLIIGELVRLGCGFTYLGASLARDLEGRDADVEIPRLRRAFESARQRSVDEVSADRQTLAAIVEGLSRAAA